MKLLSIIGARPQFIKLAPFIGAIDRHNADDTVEMITHRIVHTGQHYDAAMSDVFFKDLGLPAADVNLGVGSDTHAQQTGAMMIGIEHVLQNERPDLIVVYGDTNSTLAGALAATKLRIPCAHVEAGLRSFNREMPEELNRVIADHVSDLLLAPTRTAMTNLEREGLAQRAVLTGDLMYDAVIHYRSIAQRSSMILERLELQQGAYGVVTLHRAENTDDRARIAVLLGTLNEIARDRLPLVFPVHPRTTARIATLLPNWRPHANLRLIEPVGYLDSVNLLANASICMTDSGGLQKEAFFLGCPCITLRPETEWIETVEAHANIITDCDTQRILGAFERWQDRYPNGQAAFSTLAAEQFGNGYAAETILLNLLKFLDKRGHTSAGPDLASGDLFSNTKPSGDEQ